MRTIFLLFTIAILLMLIAPVTCLGQSEWVGRDTSVVVLRGGAFHTSNFNGMDLSIGGGLFGWLNVGASYTHWNDDRFSYYDYYYSQSTGHNATSAYVEFFPVRVPGRVATGSAGVAFIVGNAGTGGKDSYYGFAGSAYLNLRVVDVLYLVPQIGWAVIIPSGIGGSSTQTSFGLGTSLRLGPGVKFLGTVVHSRAEDQGTTTFTGGLAFPIARHRAGN